MLQKREQTPKRGSNEGKKYAHAVLCYVILRSPLKKSYEMSKEVGLTLNPPDISSGTTILVPILCSK
jgi:hypothetical protein